MRFKRTSFVGERPVFTGSPHIVEGGFTLDKTEQNFNVGDIIPAGSFAHYNEQSRKVLVNKSAKVKAINATDAKIVTLEMSNYLVPIFAVGDKIGTSTMSYSESPSITKIEKSDTSYVITLSAAISGLSVNKVLSEIKSDAAWVNYDSAITKVGLVASDVVVNEDDTPIDVVDNTMQYAAFYNRIPPLYMNDMSAGGLIDNSAIRITFSY